MMQAKGDDQIQQPSRSQLPAQHGGSAIRRPTAAVQLDTGGGPGYDIVILAGQSNMSGRGTPYSQSLGPSDRRIDQFKSKAPRKDTIVPATEPLDMLDVPSGIGPGMQFARHYANHRLAPERKLLLVPVAYGGTQLSTDATPLGWRWGVPGNLTEQAITQTLAAKAAADAIDTTQNSFVALLWLQGETDGDNHTTPTQYRADLDALFDGVRTSLCAPRLPIVVGTMVPEYLHLGTRTGIDIVHRDTPNRLPRTAIAISAVGMHMNDDNHFNGPGSRFNGRAMYEAYERILETPEPHTHLH